MLFYILLFSSAALIYWKIVRPRWYWAKRGIQQIAFGGYLTADFTRSSFPDIVQYIYDKFPTSRYFGVYVFFRPVLVIKDLDLIRQITVKDFDHFTDHISILSVGEDYEPLWSKNLLVSKGRRWREIRDTLSPAFTCSKMRAMFYLMNECAQKFVNHFHESDSTVQNVDLKDVLTRYTNDVIATCAFGVQCDSVAETDNEFYKMGKEVADFSGFWRSFKFSVVFAIPKIARFLGIKVFSREACNFFMNLIEDTVAIREEKKILRPDLLNLLMEARNGRLKCKHQPEESDAPKEKMSLIDMSAQAFLFFIGGFESVSSVMCFMGYELGVNPDIQQRLFEEIMETLHECNGDVRYDDINKMKYFEMVVSETLRLWPNFVAFDRVCTKPYKIEPKTKSEVPITLETGTCVSFPVWGLHHDPQYHPNPHTFDPERFSEENKCNIKPYTYLPFGAGPRTCIGARFALLEAKAVYFHLLSKFEIVASDQTQIPLKLAKSGFVVTPEKGFWLGLKKRGK